MLNLKQGGKASPTACPEDGENGTLVNSPKHIVEKYIDGISECELESLHIYFNFRS